MSMNWKNLGLASLLLSCPALAKTAVPDKAELASRTESMARLMTQRENPTDTMKLDLADDAQYQFVVSRLLASGNTPQNSPRLFKRLEAARAQAKAGTLASSECTHSLDMQSKPVLGTALYTGRALMACRFGNQDYAFSDVGAWQTNEDGSNLQQLSYRSAEDYKGAGRFENAAMDFSYSHQDGKKLQLDSLVLSFDDASGGAYASYAMTAITGEDAASSDFSTQGTIEQIVVQHPRDIVVASTGNTIRVCSIRGTYAGGHQDCDYGALYGPDYTVPFRMWPDKWPEPIAPWGMAAYGGGTVWNPDFNNLFFRNPAIPFNSTHTFMPISGLLDAGKNTLTGASCTITSINTATFEMVYQGGSPTCGYATGSVVATGDLKFAFSAPGYDTAAFRGLATGGTLCGDTSGNPADFYQKALSLRLRFNYTRNCGGTIQTRTISLNYAPIIDIRNSCLAEGTEILMADGSKKSVQDVKVGDRVVADAKGTVLTVMSVSRGGENGKMVQLETDKGHKVTVTGSHPVLTARGVSAAGELRKGDKVQTREGLAALTAVRSTPADTTVYNMAVGTPEELEKTGNAGTLFAGGLLMGDQRMQVELEDRNVSMASAPARGSVSKAWRQDYRNDKARGALVH